MTDDSLKTQQKRQVKKADRKSALKSPAIIAKIPLPYLGGGVAAIVMVIFVVIKAAITPFPGELVAQQSSSSEQQQPVLPEQSVLSQQDQQANPSASAPAQPLVPVYNGPQADVIASADAALPSIAPYDFPATELGRRVQMDLAAFEEQTTLHETPDIGSDTALGYGVRLPKDWVAVGQNAATRGQGVVDILANFVSPPIAGLRQSLMIEVQKVPFMMDIRDFVAMRAKTDLITYQSISFYGKNRGEVLYVVPENNLSYVVRSVSIMSGDRVVTASYRVPADQYDANQDIQTWAITRFYVMNANDNLAEETKPGDFLDLATFQYPASWRLQKLDVQTIERMRISITNTPADMPVGDSGVLKGQIDVVTFVRDAQNSEARMIDMMNTLVAGQGVHLGEPIGRFDIVSQKGLEPVFARVYPLIDQNGSVHPYQYWLVQFKGPKRFFMVGLFTPIRAQSFSEWVQNYGAFKTVVGSVQEGAGQE